jgi:fructosamine-3-kinase
MRTFTKHRHDAPAGFFAAEAAGLSWLAEAEPRGGVRVARTRAVAADRIELERLVALPPTPGAAEDFGRRLAATHAAGAAWFGCPPPSRSADGFVGPLRLPHATTPGEDSWGAFYARLRLRPYLDRARASGSLVAADAEAVAAVCERLEEGDPALTGPGEPPARLHGDLWSGNVLWTAGGAVLIDPAAHGGHRETDLAMLALFGLPNLPQVLTAYDEAAPLADGWRHRVPLHQLHPLLVHAVLFGGAYGAEAGRAARSCR